MDDKKIEKFNEVAMSSSGFDSSINEESKDISQLNRDKKIVTSATDCLPDIVECSAQDNKQIASKPTEDSIDGEDFSLRLESSDEETLFKDAIGAAVAPKEIKTDVKKSSIADKSENLFSDIESSDDSIVYEPKSKLEASPGEAEQSSEKAAIPASVCEEKKVIESEFDPVESDEEFFEDLPIAQKIDQLSQETISDKSLDEEERNSTPLIDEENSKCTKPDLQSEEVNKNADEADESKVIESVETPEHCIEESSDTPKAESVLITTEISNSPDLVDDKPTDVGDEVIDGTVLVAADTEENNVLSARTPMSEEFSRSKGDAPETDMGTSKEEEEIDDSCLMATASPQNPANSPGPDEKLEGLAETQPIGEIETSESSIKILMSSTVLENEVISPSIPQEAMETDDFENADESNLDGDETEENNLLKFQLDDSELASENENPEEAEPMQIDETQQEESEVLELETMDDDSTVEKTDSQCLQKNQEQEEEEPIEKDTNLEAVKEQETCSKSVDASEKSENITAVKSKESSDDEKETEESSITAHKSDESNEDFLEKEKVVKLNKAQSSNDLAAQCEPIQTLEATEIDKTETHNILSTPATLSDDDEMQQGETTENENLVGDEVKSLAKSDDMETFVKDVSDETGKLDEITSNPVDDPTALDCNEKSVEKNVEKSSKTTEKSLDDQIEDETETAADVEGKSQKLVEKPLETSEISNDKKESSKEGSDEKFDRSAADAMEKVESLQQVLDTSEESNKELSDCAVQHEISEEIEKKVDETKEKSPQKNLESSDPTQQTVPLINALEDKVEDAMGTSESLQITENASDNLDKQGKNIEESAQPTKEQCEKPSVSETDSIEKQVSITESTESQEAAASQAPALSQEPDMSQKSVVSQETSESGKPAQSESKETVKIESIKLLNIETPIEAAETPEVAAEVVVEKVVEIATSNESTSSTKIPDLEIQEDIKKSATQACPEIIEIDDDDDDLEEGKKLEDKSNKKDEIASSLSSNKDLKKKTDDEVKVSPEDKKTDDSTKASQATENKEIVTPMEVDKENAIDKPAEESKKDQESAVKDDNTTTKGIPVQVLDDDEEPLLVIDTSHKEDNDNESNFMDTETATSAPTTDSSSDGSLEVFSDKECVNYECKRECKNYYRATVFAMNYFKVSKKRTKTQFVCEECYDRALSSYEELCKTLKLKQPLLHGTTFKCQEFVEIIDSSDEEESDTGGDKVKVSDENALPKESIEMLEAELEGAIRKVMHNVDIQKQLSWTKQILQQRLTNLQEDSSFVSEQLRALQRKADHMHNSLYQCPKIKLRQLTPLDLNSGRMYNPESDNSTSIPLPGDIIRNPICVNEQYYAVKTKAIASWVPCKVIEEVEGYGAGYSQSKSYKIRFTKLAKYPMFKTVYAKHMAYYDPPNVRLPIGSRVIAYFDATSLSRGKEKMLIPSAFYPGIIAEPLKQSNKFRYLVFYDDGYFQYVNHKDVRLVCQASENVWEDVHHQSREFIHNYLTQYAVNRPMVQTQKGQSMLVDYNGKWIYARVIDVDCSLVQMLFEGQSRSEWIYRGSTRLGPVYKESNNLSTKNTLNATRRRTEPFIRYINGDDSSSSQQVQETEQPQNKAGSSEIRSVAKKSVSRVDTSNNNNNNNSNSATSSTAQPVPTVRHLNNSTIFVDDDNKPKGKVVYYTARKNLPPRNYVPHICNPACPFNITHNLSFYSPLAKPLLSGWERQVFRQKSKKFIIYRGPCGKRMRNIEELHRYLRVTENELNVDNFDFSPDTNCLAEYVLEKCLVNKKDISCGKEKMPIPCVNYYDDTMPPACEYSAERIPTEGVPLNLDEEFLCGCDCVDDCSDKTKCACWQLTYAGAKYGMPTVPIDMVGYQYKRLYEHVPTGIYECNSRCRCKANCVNRVVQQPLQSKLQVFKTSNRGWGLRCINDVPRGSFICVYAGQMLTEQVANEGGLDAGDEYFAELDYIEVAEQIKEGYESDVQEPDEDEDIYNPDREDDDTDFRAPGESFKDKEFNTRLRARKGNKNSTDGEFDSQERQVISFEPNKTMDTSNEPNEKPTIRKLFGKDESCYVMDAKVRGNLGRYFNHSCSPNLFVQNVFVDTHDLRFPWVAFFASTHIRAGTELTWNYNYEVGVVPGKVLYCQCGAPNCRQRLL